MIIRRLVLAVLLLAAPAANALDKDPYLFDMLKEPTYLAAWKAMLKGEQVPSWVANYAKTFDGPSTPSKTVTIGSQAYLLGYVCKAHDCGDNQLHVLFAPAGKQAWGCSSPAALTRNGSASPTPPSRPQSRATRISFG